MRRLLLSAKAQADLGDIWDYTAGDWGLEQAEIYIRRLWQHMSMLAQNPEMGGACPQIRQGYRRYKSGAHVIFYKHTADKIEVIRVLHERMDFGRHVP